jgi:hypothetical protein
MKVWKLGCDCNKDINIRTAIDYFQENFIVVPIAATWKPPAIRNKVE